MTKIIALRVTVAVDDSVDLKDAKTALAAIILERGTERITDAGNGRAHWATAEVLQGPDRINSPLSRRKKLTAVPNTGDLLAG